MAGVQFSLRKLLLSIAVVVLILSHLLTSYQLWVTNDELQQLKRRQGILVVEDETRAQVLNIDLQEPKTWRWRVYLPKGRSYLYHVQTSGIPLAGIPNDGGSSGPLVDGEQEITAKLQRDERGDWTLGIYTASGRMWNDVRPLDSEWLEHPRGYSSKTANDESYDSGEPIVLLRMRAPNKGTNTRPPTGATDGVMIWIQPE